MYTLEDLKNDIYNDIYDERMWICNPRNTYEDICVVSVSDINDIINKRLDEFFNRLLSGEEEYCD